MTRKKKGFTLIEIMVVVAIIAILAVLAMFMFMNNLAKGRDAQRKADLDRLKIAFEEYYNDHNCYPPAEWFDSTDDCNSAHLAPYLSNIPCDQNTGVPYVLETDDTTCKWFKLYATFDLPDTDKQALAQRSATGSTKGNYGVSSSNTIVSVYFATPTPTPSPSPSPSLLPLPSTIPGVHACSRQGVCNNYQDNPLLPSCPLTWSDSVPCVAYCPSSPLYARCPN